MSAVAPCRIINQLITAKPGMACRPLPSCGTALFLSGVNLIACITLRTKPRRRLPLPACL